MSLPRAGRLPRRRHRQIRYDATMSRRLALVCTLPLACTSPVAATDGGSEPTAGETGATTHEASTTGAGSTDASTTDVSTTGAPTTGDSPDGLHPIPADPQRDGDPDAGYHALVNNGYVSCGIPWTAYSQVFTDAPEELRLPGRDGKNANLPYDKTAFVGASGVELVSANCLQCHAGEIDGQLVIGLGNASADFTVKVGGSAALADLLLDDPAEKAELQRFVARLNAVEPYTQTLTLGANPADNIAAVLFSHRDPWTMEWFDEPLLDLPPVVVTPVDVPPWWHMKKKHAMFYVGAGRGDHARTMMAASTLCTDDIDEARAIDEYFPDIRAYLLTLEPPAYPFAVDAALAAAGQQVFAATCAGCHGTYGAEPTYPNLLVDLDVIATDAALATDASQFAGRYVDWFTRGSTARSRGSSRRSAMSRRRSTASGRPRRIFTTARCRRSPRCSTAPRARSPGPAATSRPTTTPLRSAGSTRRSITARKASPRRTCASGSTTPPSPATATAATPSATPSTRATAPP
ncbi:hypothetical protein OV079_19395 [Nannocystis pusilla]|uniref:Cytochrome c domain-containing protein n=1 Tax=Nannocystis pusilla TaxID=889268 RepID=A0A9X3IXP2_9BACT|nr:c-type cytochrome [Nannocystis pusilla]MCY1007676.1 hypothetical protein [Nannocystis pusilla]